jgi:ABC-2 type transport system permease protein
MNIGRVLAFSTRYLFLYKRSLPRLMEIFYWPIIDLLLWGFVGMYLTKHQGTTPDIIGFFLGALILWDILFRSQQGISISFLEDIWSRNLLNIFTSPISQTEYIATLLLMSVIKLCLASAMMVGLAYLFYTFNIFTFGLSLIPLAANLIIMGWSIGIITTAIILRYGQQAEVLAWGIAFLFQPVSAVFYPVDVLPGFLQKIAWCVPASHVFEGMRSVLAGAPLPIDQLVIAFGLNCAYIVAAILFFRWNFSAVKRKGLLVKGGE